MLKSELLKIVRDAALQNGTYISCKPQNEFLFQCSTHCDFTMTILKQKKFNIYQSMNNKELKSLALVDKNLKCIRAYADKLPLMIINAYRLKYTILAFLLNNDNKYTYDKALEFYLNYEIDNIDTKLKPNEMFNAFLHSLQTSGTEQYIFALARHLKMNVDLMKNDKFVYRYIYNYGLDKKKSVLTALLKNNVWFVEVSEIHNKSITFNSD